MRWSSSYFYSILRMFLSSRMLCVLLAYRIAQVKPDSSGFFGRNLSNIERKCRILSRFLFCPNSRNSQNTRLLRPFPTVLQKKSNWNLEVGPDFWKHRQDVQTQD